MSEDGPDAAGEAGRSIEVGWRLPLVAVAIGAALLAGVAWRAGWLGGLGRAGGDWPVPAPPAAQLDAVEPDVRAAIDAARADVARDPRSAAAWRHLGMVYDAHAMWPFAAEAYGRAVALDPADAKSAYYLAAALGTSGRPIEEVEAAYRRAAELAPDYGPIWLLLGEALTNAGRLLDARAAYEQAIAVYPHASSARAHRALGMALLSLGDPDGAFVELNTALTIRDDDKVTHATLAQVYNQLQQGDKAREAAARAAELDETLGYFDPWRLEVLELTMTQRLVEDRIRSKALGGDLEAALADAARWEARHPDWPSIQRAIGNILREAGRPDLAEPYFERARALVAAGQTR